MNIIFSSEFQQGIFKAFGNFPITLMQTVRKLYALSSESKKGEHAALEITKLFYLFQALAMSFTYIAYTKNEWRNIMKLKLRNTFYINLLLGALHCICI